MKRTVLSALLVLSAAFSLSACAPATSGAAGPDIVATRDGADVVIPNPGEALRDHWGLVIDVSPDWKTNDDVKLWCPIHEMRTSPSLGAFLRYQCDMPALAQNALRRIKTVEGKIFDLYGGGYRASTGEAIVKIQLK